MNETSHTNSPLISVFIASLSITHLNIQFPCISMVLYWFCSPILIQFDMMDLFCEWLCVYHSEKTTFHFYFDCNNKSEKTQHHNKYCDHEDGKTSPYQYIATSRWSVNSNVYYVWTRRNAKIDIINRTYTKPVTVPAHEQDIHNKYIYTRIPISHKP